MELDASLIEKIANYQPSPARLATVGGVSILFLVGISGAGKNTIIHRLLDAYPDQYHLMISHTTRKKRENRGVMERDGVEYHFVDFDTVNTMLDNGDFVEAKVVHRDNVYGTSIAELEKAQREHKIAMADIEVQGVQEYVDLGLRPKPVFILPPNYEIWHKRMINRYGGTIDEADLHKRMQTARLELQHALDTDYFYLVVNDDLDQTVRQINAIMHGQPVSHRDEHAETVLRSLLHAF